MKDKRPEVIYRIYSSKLLEKAKKEHTHHELAQMFGKYTSQMSRYIHGLFIPSNPLSAEIIKKFSKHPKIEEWNKANPKTGIMDQTRKKLVYPSGKVRWGKYGNYLLRDKLMNLIDWLENDFNVVQIPKAHGPYFKALEKNIISLAKKMSKML